MIRASAREHAFQNERGSKCYRACFSETLAGASAREHAFQNYELSRDERFEKMASRNNIVFWIYKRQQCDLNL